MDAWEAESLPLSKLWKAPPLTPSMAVHLTFPLICVHALFCESTKSSYRGRAITGEHAPTANAKTTRYFFIVLFLLYLQPFRFWKFQLQPVMACREANDTHQHHAAFQFGLIHNDRYAQAPYIGQHFEESH